MAQQEVLVSPVLCNACPIVVECSQFAGWIDSAAGLGNQLRVVLIVAPILVDVVA